MWLVEYWIENTTTEAHYYLNTTLKVPVIIELNLKLVISEPYGTLYVSLIKLGYHAD